MLHKTRRHNNRLAVEELPFLLQHWFAWCGEVFAKAGYGKQFARMMEGVTFAA